LPGVGHGGKQTGPNQILMRVE